MIAEIVANLNPQINTAQEAVIQYVPFFTIMGTVTLAGLRQFLQRNGDNNQEALLDVANDIVVHANGSQAHFTARDIGVHVDVCARSANGQEMVNPRRGAIRPDQTDKNTLRGIFCHGHTKNVARLHVPVKRGGRFRRNQLS